MRRSWWWAVLPLVLGMAADALLNTTDRENPIVYMRADLGTVLFLTGVMLSALILFGLLVVYQYNRIQLDSEAQAIQDRRRFIRLLDHELKNPLTAIMAGLANLDEGRLADDQRPTLNSVRSQVQRLGRLVADLRKLSDLETRELELAPLDLGEVLADVYELTCTEKGYGERHIHLQIPQAPWPLPEVIGDRDLLFLALLNVADNALKFSQPGDTIELRAFEDGQMVVIEIADTGPGIPAQEIELVWSELFRGEGARGIPGSGLGMALVQAIVARHHGKAVVRSRVGQGTVVSLQIPLGDVTKL